MAEVRIPEHAALPQTIQTAAAVAEAVEVLLVGKRETSTHTRRAIRTTLDGHPAVGGLSQQPRAGRIGERQAQRVGLDLEPQSARRQPHGLTVGDLERGRRPGVGRDERGLARLVRAEAHTHDAGAAERDRDRAVRAREGQARVPTLEAWHVAARRSGRHA